MLRLTRRIVNDQRYWKDRDLELFSVGPIPDGTGVEVTTSDPEKARRLLSERYGAEMLIIRKGTPAVWIEK